MKYLKHFEDNNDEIQIGEYVICDEKGKNHINIDTFIKNNIGVYIRPNAYDKRYPYLIKYENVPDEIRDHFDVYTLNWNLKKRRDNKPEIMIRVMSEDEVLYHSFNKEELELKLNANKYNL